jgi:hypothetical protein
LPKHIGIKQIISDSSELTERNMTPINNSNRNIKEIDLIAKLEKIEKMKKLSNINKNSLNLDRLGRKELKLINSLRENILKS